MAYNFKNLADVELLDTMPESANVFVEVDGATKRAPMKNNASEEKTLIIKDSNFDSMVSGIAPAETLPEEIYTANMTFEEAVAALMKCELNKVYLYRGFYTDFDRITIQGVSYCPLRYVAPCLVISCWGDWGDLALYWTAENGISNLEPEMEK